MKLKIIKQNGQDLKVCPVCDSVPLYYSMADQKERYGYYCLLCEVWYNINTQELEQNQKYPPVTSCLYCCEKRANLAAKKPDGSIYWICVDCYCSISKYLSINLIDKKFEEYNKSAKEKNND